MFFGTAASPCMLNVIFSERLPESEKAESLEDIGRVLVKQGGLCSEGNRRSAAGRRCLYTSPAPVARDGHKKRWERQHRRLVHSPRWCMFEATSRYAVFLFTKVPPGAHRCNTYIPFLMCHNKIFTMFNVKRTKVSPMCRMSHCFEGYSVLLNYHSRRGHTRSVKLVYFLPSPQSHKTRNCRIIVSYAGACKFSRGRDISLG